jgi:hypothetical protein
MDSQYLMESQWAEMAQLSCAWEASLRGLEQNGDQDHLKSTGYKESRAASLPAAHYTHCMTHT